jgi:hypothetical protein
MYQKSYLESGRVPRGDGGWPADVDRTTQDLLIDRVRRLLASQPEGFDIHIVASALERFLILKDLKPLTQRGQDYLYALAHRTLLACQAEEKWVLRQSQYPKTLNDDERNALDHVARLNGRTWKSQLRRYWAKEFCDIHLEVKDFDMYPTLRLLQTAPYFGLKGLNRYQPTKETVNVTQ